MTGRVLVTGASGFVGRHLARALSERGFHVTGLDRAPAPESSVRVFEQYLQCDLLDLPEQAREREFDSLVHLAGLLPGSASPRDLYGVNVGATSVLLDRFATPRCQLVFSSTGLVYGAQPGPLREDMACLTADAYGRSKLAAEAVVGAWQRATGAVLTVLRPSVIYGADAPPFMLLRSIFTALRDRVPLAMTAGEQLRDFLHVDDAVEAVTTVLERRLGGTYNLASGESRSVRAIAERCAAIAGRPELLHLGALPYRAHEIFDYRLDPGALRAALGWRPRVDLDAGLERLWRELSCS